MNLKTISCQAIADAIEAGVPLLAGKVGVGQADMEARAPWPALRVIPRRVNFQPWQEESIDEGISQTETDVDDVVSGYELSRVGDFDGILEVRLYCEYEAQREDLEEQILQLFYATEGAPGSLVATTAAVVLGTVTTLHEAIVSAYLDGDLWQEEMVFAKKRMSFIDLNFAYPALVARGGVYTIDELRIAITTRLTDETPQEVVSVDENGVMTPSS
jgi:hypothetical protein